MKVKYKFDSRGLYKDMTPGKEYRVLNVVEGMTMESGVGSPIPYVAYRIRDDAGDIVTRDADLFRKRTVGRRRAVKKMIRNRAKL